MFFPVCKISLCASRNVTSVINLAFHPQGTRHCFLLSLHVLFTIYLLFIHIAGGCHSYRCCISSSFAAITNLGYLGCSQFLLCRQTCTCPKLMLLSCAVKLPLTYDDPINERSPKCPSLNSHASSCKSKPVVSFTESIHLMFSLPLFLLLSAYPL